MSLMLQIGEHVTKTYLIALIFNYCGMKPGLLSPEKMKTKIYNKFTKVQAVNLKFTFLEDECLQPHL